MHGYFAFTPRLLVFDLDGTLYRLPRRLLCNSVNATLTYLGKPKLPPAVIGTYIGDGAPMLIRRALGDPSGDLHDEEYVTKALTFFLDFYRIHKLDFTYVYPKASSTRSKPSTPTSPPLPMAVLTNKPVRPSRDICAHFGLNRFLFQNYGGNSFHTKKPDPHGLLTLIAEANALQPGQPVVTPSTTVMIGDSDIDILTARNCGARSIGCTFGLSPHTLAAAQPDALAGSADQWPALLGISTPQANPSS